MAKFIGRSDINDGFEGAETYKSRAAYEADIVKMWPGINMEALRKFDAEQESRGRKAAWKYSHGHRVDGARADDADHEGSYNRYGIRIK